MSDKDRLLDRLIKDFSKDKLVQFYKLSSDKFRPVSEDFSDNLPEDDKRFESIEQIGRIEHEKKAKSIAFFISSVSGEISERDSKKKQYDIGKKILKDNYLDAGIFVFYGRNNFRLSLIAASYSGPKRKFTTFKRYTYFVSPELTNKTFKDQLRKCDFSSVEKILSSFSIEAVSNEFYNNFKPIFDEIVNAIQGKNDIDVQTKQDFALLFAIRVIFLGFVQKKRWLSDNQKFIQNFWDEYNKHKKKSKYSDEFYIQWLEPLFFEALNSQPGTKVQWKNNDFSEQTEKTLQMAPFLNGELFKRKTDVDDIGLFLPDEIIGTYFDFLFQYNFTIDESTAYDEEIELNPEFLGIIFERFVSKEQGSVYTPRTEVDLMCRLALLRWLVRKNEFDTKELYHLFFREGGAELEFEEDQKYGSFSANEIRKLLNFLESVTVCDPAAGSGAFEVGMLHVINELIETLYTKMPDFPEDVVKKQPYERKKDIIAKSLYGVEVQGYAVWINQLRLWLTLFIDMPDKMKLSLTPLLPSLNFKIRKGDSLVQRIGNKMFPVQGDTDLPKPIREKIDELKEEKNNFYYNRGKDEKFIYKLETEVFKKIVDGQIKSKQKKLDLIEKPQKQMTFDRTQAEQKHLLELANFEKKRNELYSETEELRAEYNNLTDKHPLIWSVEFSEIFYDKGGFDIIIGNPPYVNQLEIADPEVKVEPKEYKKLLRQAAALDYPRHFKDRKISGKSDLYTFFYVRTLHLLNKEGVHCFICSNSWLDVEYGIWLQEFLLENVPVNLVIDNHARRSFASSDVNTVITLFDAPVKSYDKAEHLVKFIAFKKPFEECIFTEMLWDIHQAKQILKNDIFRVYPITAEKLYDEGWEVDQKTKSKQAGKYIGDKWGGRYIRLPDFLVKFMDDNKFIKLKDIVEFNRGKTVGLVDFFILDKTHSNYEKIGKEFLKDIITSTKEIETYTLEPSIIEKVVFTCPYGIDKLRKNYLCTYKYVLWGSSQKTKKKAKHTKSDIPWPEVPTVKNNKPEWHCIELNKAGNFIVPRLIREKFFFAYNPLKLFESDMFFHGEVKCEINPIFVVGLLNSTITYLYLEIYGRINVPGRINIYGPDLKPLPLPNPEHYTQQQQKEIENAFNIMAKRNVEKIFSELGHSKDYVANKPFLESLKEDDLELGTVLKDRYNLDQQVLIPIGFTNEDILNVYRTLSSLVKNRLIKAITM